MKRIFLCLAILAVLASSAWAIPIYVVATVADPTGGQVGKIIEYETSTTAELLRFDVPAPVGPGWVGLAYADDVLYYISGNDGVLYELDPILGTVLDSTLIAGALNNVDGLATLGGKVYILDSTNDDLIVFDPALNTVDGTIDLSPTGVGFKGGLGTISGSSELIASAPGAGYFLTADLYSIDPATGLATWLLNASEMYDVYGVDTHEGIAYVAGYSFNSSGPPWSGPAEIQGYDTATGTYLGGGTPEGVTGLWALSIGEVTPAVIPEPGTLTLLGLGLLAAARRRRNRRR
ncbi:MAG TPA: PEP-CTERM sorting domain-containing protein [Planctomycetota bacterium]|nr:PEP-CTERM sorting domain-containing protein [Planctomycetota bacterium]